MDAILFKGEHAINLTWILRQRNSWSMATNRHKPFTIRTFLALPGGDNCRSGPFVSERPDSDDGPVGRQVDMVVLLDVQLEVVWKSAVPRRKKPHRGRVGGVAQHLQSGSSLNLAGFIGDQVFM